jgi:UDP-N-acetylmuramoylalanine--D-glutamate ligase
MENFKDKRISVIGAARSGMDAARILSRLGALVVLSDSQTPEQIGPERLALLHDLDVNFVLGANSDMALPPHTELVVTSPGVPKTAPVLQAARQRNIPVWSEIELAYRLTNAPIIAITGTNGKTTTTLLLAHILQTAGKNAVVAGNISADDIKRTLVEAAFEADKDTILDAEISSFQLEWVEKFAPHVAILTNITPDHLNRHSGFEEYAQTKARLFAAQTADDWAILNYDNPASRRIGELDPPGRRAWFTRQATPPDAGDCAWVREGFLTLRSGGGCPVALMPDTELPATLPGAHSVENVLAASLAAFVLGVPAETIAAAVRSFGGVAHRMEFVRDLDGVRYINNSMCTNVAAAVSSLLAMDRPTVVIMGGADKQLEYAPIASALHEKAKHVILIGQVADKMEAAFLAGGYKRISRATTLEDAVTQARSFADEGEAVLLLPACASFDMFRDFEARGVAFRQAVHALTSSADSTQSISTFIPTTSLPATTMENDR